jgi:hypothetical protein
MFRTPFVIRSEVPKPGGPGGRTNLRRGPNQYFSPGYYMEGASIASKISAGCEFRRTRLGPGRKWGRHTPIRDSIHRLEVVLRANGRSARSTEQERRLEERRVTSGCHDLHDHRDRRRGHRHRHDRRDPHRGRRHTRHDLHRRPSVPSAGALR